MYEAIGLGLYLSGFFLLFFKATYQLSQDIIKLFKISLSER